MNSVAQHALELEQELKNAHDTDTLTEEVLLHEIEMLSAVEYELDQFIRDAAALGYLLAKIN